MASVVADIAPAALWMIIVIIMAILFAVFQFSAIQATAKAIKSLVETGVNGAAVLLGGVFAQVEPMIEKLVIEGGTSVKTIDNSVIVGVNAVISLSDAILLEASTVITNGFVQLVETLQIAIQCFFEILSVWTNSWLQNMQFFAAQLSFLVEVLSNVLIPVEWVIGVLNSIIHLFS
jgi:hypothetical protein